MERAKKGTIFIHICCPLHIKKSDSQLTRSKSANDWDNDIIPCLYVGAVLKDLIYYIIEKRNIQHMRQSKRSRRKKMTFLVGEMGVLFIPFHFLFLRYDVRYLWCTLINNNQHKARTKNQRNQESPSDEPTRTKKQETNAIKQGSLLRALLCNFELPTSTIEEIVTATSDRWLLVSLILL